MGKENDSPWNETDKLLVEVTSSFVAAETSPALPFLGSRSGVKGLAVLDRRRSTETDLFEAREGAGVEFLETRGEGNLLEEEEEEENDEEFEVEVVEVEGEGDMYREETILDLGFLGLPEIPLLLSFSEGNNGGLRPWSAGVALGFCGSVAAVEAAPETAATIITIEEEEEEKKKHTPTHTNTHTV